MEFSCGAKIVGEDARASELEESEVVHMMTE